ncbi:hypothetical protein B6D29_03970 [Microgenomates bacterium UTCPR1]|nr:MAG: hypothetical protein B6D29_03970 [Microgenomates bacterium UTCPR1]
MSDQLSRRDFLKLGGLGALGALGRLGALGALGRLGALGALGGVLEACGPKIPEYKDRGEISYGDGRHVLFNGRTYLRGELPSDAKRALERAELEVKNAFEKKGHDLIFPNIPNNQSDGYRFDESRVSYHVFRLNDGSLVTKVLIGHTYPNNSLKTANEITENSLMIVGEEYMPPIFFKKTEVTTPDGEKSRVVVNYLTGEVFHIVTKELGLMDKFTSFINDEQKLPTFKISKLRINEDTEFSPFSMFDPGSSEFQSKIRDLQSIINRLVVTTGDPEFDKTFKEIFLREFFCFDNPRENVINALKDMGLSDSDFYSLKEIARSFKVSAPLNPQESTIFNAIFNTMLDNDFNLEESLQQIKKTIKDHNNDFFNFIKTLNDHEVQLPFGTQKLYVLKLVKDEKIKWFLLGEEVATDLDQEGQSLHLEDGKIIPRKDIFSYGEIGEKWVPYFLSIANRQIVDFPAEQIAKIDREKNKPLRRLMRRDGYEVGGVFSVDPEALKIVRDPSAHDSKSIKRGLIFEGDKRGDYIFYELVKGTFWNNDQRPVSMIGNRRWPLIGNNPIQYEDVTDAILQYSAAGYDTIYPHFYDPATLMSLLASYANSIQTKQLLLDKLYENNLPTELVNSIKFWNDNEKGSYVLLPKGTNIFYYDSQTKSQIKIQVDKPVPVKITSIQAYANNSEKLYGIIGNKEDKYLTVDMDGLVLLQADSNFDIAIREAGILATIVALLYGGYTVYNNPAILNPASLLDMIRNAIPKFIR